MHIHLHMHAEHNDTMKKTSDTVPWKIYLSLNLKGCVWEGVGNRTELQHIDPHSYGHQSFLPVLLMLLNRRPGGPPSTGCWLSLPHLVSKLVCSLNWSGLQTYWLPVNTELYNSSTSRSSCGRQTALIQPIHGQGYNSDIPRPDAPVIYIGAFPIFTARPGRRSI